MRYPLAGGPRCLASPALLALALAACSGGDTPAPPPSEEPSAAASAPALAASVEAAVEEATVTSAETTASEGEDQVEATPAAQSEPKPEPKPEPTPSPTKAAAPPPPAAPEPVAAAGPPAAFNRCAVCHNASKGAPDKLGPNLYGVFGHKMGQGGFAYSDALKSSGLTMDEATLHQWLENPRKLVPGNRMSFPGIKDEAKRQEIIDYLKQQR